MDQLAGGEIGQLSLGRGPAEHGVAVRLAPEAGDHVAMSGSNRAFCPELGNYFPRCGAVKTMRR